LSVNLPQTEMPPHPRSRRFVHIHRNVSGVIADISRVLAGSNLNITGESLRTTDELGYALFDVEGNISEEITAALRGVTGTIRVRFL
jgi:D-3-phosphoglycerate dehydrogenase